MVAKYYSFALDSFVLPFLDDHFSLAFQAV